MGARDKVLFEVHSLVSSPALNSEKGLHQIYQLRCLTVGLPFTVFQKRPRNRFGMFLLVSIKYTVST